MSFRIDGRNESGSSAVCLRFADARRTAIPGLPSSANNTGNEDDSPQDQSDFKYEATIRNEFPPAIRLPRGIHPQISPHRSQRNTLI